MLVALAVAAGCGVEVPDDVAAEAATTTTAEVASTTTETPRSDDELEQALIDNGYTAEEARCGAENLRAELDPDEVASIVGADTIEDISPSTAQAFADALRPCVESGGAAGGDPGPGSGSAPSTPGDDGDDGEGGGGSEERRPGDDIGGGMPGFGDDSEGDVSRSRFLSALIVSGVADDVARCIVDGTYAELDQEQINTLFHARSADELPEDLLDAFNAIVADCE